VDVVVNNLFAGLPGPLAEELTSVLVQSPHVRIERIVSCGQRSPDRFWYDQQEAEWIVVLRGAGQLQIEGESAARHLTAGDHLLIPAGVRHRVEWTTSDEPTIWLAVFFAEGADDAVPPRHMKESKHGPV
jgi:cupin 2 domain-containing protein